MNLSRALTLVALLAVGCGGDHHARPDALPERDAARVLERTAWLDRAPERESDVVHAWVFPRRQGLYFTGNAFKGSFETFHHAVEGDQLRIRFDDDGARHDVRFRIEPIDDRTFDYRLVLDRSPRGPSVYYGIDPGRRDVPDAVAAVLAHLPR